MNALRLSYDVAHLAARLSRGRGADCRGKDDK